MPNSTWILLLPVLTGLVFLVVRRNERRRQFVEQRLNKMTAEQDSGPVERLSLLRAVSPGSIFQIPHRYTDKLNAAFAATGNRVGLLHLIAAVLVAGVTVIGFAKIILALGYTPAGQRSRPDSDGRVLELPQ